MRSRKEHVRESAVPTFRGHPKRRRVSGEKSAASPVGHRPGIALGRNRFRRGRNPAGAYPKPPLLGFDII